MALIASVYRRAGADTTADGISSRADKVIVDDVAPERQIEDPSIPRVRVVKRYIGLRPAYFAEPVDTRPESEGYYVFGGNFIYTSDSRFSDYLDRMYGALPLHDRFEEYR